MKINFLVFLSFLLAVVYTNSCTKEEYIDYYETPYEEKEIQGFYEFENGDRWIGVESTYSNSLRAYTYTAMGLIRNGRYKAYNTFFDGVTDMYKVIRIKEGSYAYMTKSSYNNGSSYCAIHIDDDMQKSGEWSSIEALQGAKFIAYSLKDNDPIFLREDTLFEFDGEIKNMVEVNFLPIFIDENEDAWYGEYGGEYSPSYLCKYNGSLTEKFDMKKRSSANKLANDVHNGKWGINYNGEVFRLVEGEIVYAQDLGLNISQGEYQDLKIDNNNIMWLSTLYDLYSYNINNDEFAHIGARLGLHDAELYVGRPYQDTYINTGGRVYKIVDNELVKEL